MENYLQTFIEEAKSIKAKIIYNEITDNRIKNAVFMLRQQWYNPVICGTKDDLEREFWSNLEKFEYIVCPDWEESAFYSAKMLGEWKVDGFISWAQWTTWHTLKALFKNVWMAEWVKRISSYFLMNTSRWLMIFADCAVQPNPTPEQLAEITYLSIQSAKTFGIAPRVALLSFSTKWSASHEMTNKVIEATKLIKQRFLDENITDVLLEWELQLDSAIDQFVAKNKIPDGSWSGGANVLIFPDLNSGNIWYKLVQYFAWAQAIWPILQWLKKPWNDLSRGCTMHDIIVLHSITLLQTRK